MQSFAFILALLTCTARGARLQTSPSRVAAKLREPTKDFDRAPVLHLQTEAQGTSGPLKAFAIILLALNSVSAFNYPGAHSGMGYRIFLNHFPNTFETRISVGHSSQMMLTSADLKKITAQIEDKQISVGLSALDILGISTDRLDEKADKLAEMNATNDRPTNYVHNKTSRAKISAANKGKVPWNANGSHSEETKRRIAESLRLSAQKRKEEKRLERERLQREEPEAFAKLLAEEEAKKAASKEKLRLRRLAEKNRRHAAKAERARAAQAINANRTNARNATGANASTPKKRRAGVANRTVSEATRRKISESARMRWKDPEYRTRNLGNRKVTNETRLKLSKAMKEQWQRCNEQGVMYWSNRNKTIPLEVREKIAEAIRGKWADPEYRKRAVEGIRNSINNGSRNFSISLQTKLKIAAKMKELWQGDSFRTARVDAMKAWAQARHGGASSRRRNTKVAESSFSFDAFVDAATQDSLDDEQQNMIEWGAMMLEVSREMADERLQKDESETKDDLDSAESRSKTESRSDIESRDSTGNSVEEEAVLEWVNQFI